MEEKESHADTSLSEYWYSYGGVNQTYSHQDSSQFLKINLSCSLIFTARHWIYESLVFFYR